MVLPDSVNYISAWAFQDTMALTSVTLGKNPIDIRPGAFWYNFVREPLKVYYKGCEADREANLTIGETNNGLTEGTWHYIDDPISDTVTHSVMDTVNGTGLAFRFELNAAGVGVKNRYEADLTNATVNYLGKDCKLIGMGAEMSNDVETIDVPAVYLQEQNEDSCAFAVRIINIPAQGRNTRIDARPYYVYSDGKEEIVVYGEVVSATYNGLANNA